MYFERVICELVLTCEWGMMLLCSVCVWGGGGVVVCKHDTAVCHVYMCLVHTQVDALSAFGGVLSIIPYMVIPLNTSNCGPTQGSFSIKKQVAKTSNHPSCSSSSPSH